MARHKHTDATKYSVQLRWPAA